MATIHPFIGTGANLALGGTTYEASNLKIKSMNWAGASRPAIDRTHLQSTAPTDGTSIGGREFMPGNLWDPGTLQVEVYWNPHATPPTVDNKTYMAAPTTYTIDISIVAGTAAGGTWRGYGFLTDFSVSGIGVDTEVLANLTFKYDGLHTIQTAPS